MTIQCGHTRPFSAELISAEEIRELRALFFDLLFSGKASADVELSTKQLKYLLGATEHDKSAAEIPGYGD